MPTRLFPNLARHGYIESSPSDEGYNCIAWAAGHADAWWDPTDPHHYWPEGVPRELTIAAFVSVFEKLGYSICGTLNFETNFEKIALYALADRPTHVARQLDDNRWTSKLGEWVDIEHALDGVEGANMVKSCKFLGDQSNLWYVFGGAI